MFQNACATEADIEWATRRENCQNFSSPILTSYFAVVYKVFFFLFAVLRLNLEYPDELWRYLSCFDTYILILLTYGKKNEKAVWDCLLSSLQFVFVLQCVILFCIAITSLGEERANLSAFRTIEFVLRFYGPVNPMGSCRARSVYLTTPLLGRLSLLSC